MTWIVVVLALLAGSFPSAVLLGRLIAGRDIRRLGSGNPGAANVARELGMRVGLLVGLLDIVKGLTPVLLGRGLELDSTALAAVAVAAVLGHDYSIFLRFRGGKGVATTFGVMLALAPVPAVLAGAVWITVLLIWRISSLASLASLALLPLLLRLTGQPNSYVIAAALLFLIAAWKHRGNIARLIAGTEPGFRDRR